MVGELNGKRNPSDVVNHYLRATAFQGTALGQAPAGTSKSIQ
jgi:predicted Zn-dependent peptidase